MRKVLFVLLGAGWLFLYVGNARAGDLPLNPMGRQAWFRADDAPAEVSGLAQTSDGLLWISSSAGLHVFDGLEFRRWSDRPSEIGNASALWADPLGGVWVGHRFGRVVRIQGRAIQAFGPSDGLPASTVVAFARDVGGVLWVTTFAGAFWLDGTVWRPPQDDWGLPREAASGLLAASDGSLWVATETAVWRRAPGQTAFRRTDVVRGLAYLTVDRTGQVWVYNQPWGLWPLDRGVKLPDVSGHPALDSWASELLIDKDGFLWAGHGAKILRLPPSRLQGPWPITMPGSPGKGSGADGIEEMSRNELGAILQDREGQVWVGSGQGLERFTSIAIHPVASPTGWHWPSLAPDPEGGVWIGQADGSLRLKAGRLSKDLQVSAPVTALSQGCTDGVWAAYGQELRSLRWDSSIKVLPLPKLPESAVVQALQCLEDGSLLMSVTRSGLWLERDGRWTQIVSPPTEPWIYPLSLAPAGGARAWVGYGSGSLWQFDGQGLVKKDDAVALGIGALLSMHVDGTRLWLGGERGLALRSGESVRRIHMTHGELIGLSGIARDREGNLWLNAASGLARATQEQRQRLSADPLATLQARWFSPQEGLVGQPVQLRPLPSIVSAPDGALWLATTSGVFRLDPSALAPLRHEISIQVLAVETGQHHIHASEGVFRLPLGSRDVRVSLRPVTLGSASGLRYQVHRAAANADWTELGEQRQVAYPDLRPGQHSLTFRVVNEEGRPSSLTTTITLEVPAFWHEETWARSALLLIAVLGLCLVLLRWYRRRRLHDWMRMQARLQEREQIARDLHDTLLQALQGLVLMLHSTLERMSRTDAFRHNLQVALDQAECQLAEGRDRLQGLVHRATLSEILVEVQSLGQELAAQHGCSFHCNWSQSLAQADLLDRQLDQLRLVLRESLLNAFRHAGAATIDFKAEAGPRALRFVVEDDGVGMPEDYSLDSSSTLPGHMGLTSMRDRARQCGARIRVQRNGHQGTTVEVVLPIARAAGLTWPLSLWRFR